MALEHLLTLQHEYSATYTRPSVFKKIEMIYDVKSAFDVIKNKKIKRGFFPHCYQFQRHKRTGRAHTTYRLFSDHPVLPPEIDGSHEPAYIEEIFIPDFAAQGGRKNFFSEMGLGKAAMDLTEGEAQLGSVVKNMEAMGVFDELQNNALSHQEMGSLGEEVDEAVMVGKKRPSSSDDDIYKGLLCWIKQGTTIEELEYMVVEPIIPGENDFIEERLRNDDNGDQPTLDKVRRIRDTTSSADTAEAIASDHEGEAEGSGKKKTVKRSRGIRGSKQVAKACNAALQEYALGRIRMSTKTSYSAECFDGAVSQLLINIVYPTLVINLCD
jgi:hypothetical protein